MSTANIQWEWRQRLPTSVDELHRTLGVDYGGGGCNDISGVNERCDVTYLFDDGLP